MSPELYEMIFKRRSVRRSVGATWTQAELDEIMSRIDELTPLDAEIPVKCRLVPRKETTCRWGEYSLLIYSKKNVRALLNVGYLFEQLDLWLAAHNIGACWHGSGLPQDIHWQGLDYVIMLTLSKCGADDFRRDISKTKRRSTWEFWQGDKMTAVAETARYAPSACNSQPWLVVCNAGKLHIYRTSSYRFFIRPSRRPIYNTIDMGIFLCFLELCLAHEQYDFDRALCDHKTVGELTPIAEYTIL